MTDRELLEFAAKAVGMVGEWWEKYPGQWWLCQRGEGNGAPTSWNPLDDDGAALRLAIDLNLKVECMANQSTARTFDSIFAGACDFPVKKDDGCNRPWATDRYAATCRAIVTAAAEIGRAMP